MVVVGKFVDVEVDKVEEVIALVVEEVVVSRQLLSNKQ